MDESTLDMQGIQKQVFDIGMFVGDLALDEDARSDYESLEGLQEELEECKNGEEVSDTLTKGTKLWEHTKGVENNVRQVELDSIQVFEFIVQKIHALRKLKTSIQILEHRILLKYKCLIIFLKEHGREIYNEVNATYIDTMNKILSAYFLAYIQAMGKLQLDIATSSDLIGVEIRSTGLSLRSREPLKNGSAVFALGDRINILKEIDQPALIPHTTEVNSRRYPYEVLFRSLHKLLMDTAASEYLFCGDFFGEESIFYEIFAGPFAVLDEHLNVVLPNCYDALGLMLMIHIVHQQQMVMVRRQIPCLDSYLDKVNISLWSRFKLVLDMHLNSLQNANIRTLWVDDIHPHYVMRRYAEFIASLVHLNVEHGDGQLDLNFERLEMAIDDLLIKLAKTFTKPKLQTAFLINNYDLIVAVLMVRTRIFSQSVHLHLLYSFAFVKVCWKLVEEYRYLRRKNNYDLNSHSSGESSSSAEKPSATDLEPLLRDFLSRREAAIELMNKDIITFFSNCLCGGRNIINVARIKLHFYYGRLRECARRIEDSDCRDLLLAYYLSYTLKEK